MVVIVVVVVVVVVIVVLVVVLVLEVLVVVIVVVDTLFKHGKNLKYGSVLQLFYNISVYKDIVESNYSLIKGLEIEK